MARLNKEQWEYIERMIDSGESITELSKTLKVSRNSIHVHMRNKKLKASEQKPQKRGFWSRIWGN